MEGIAEKTELKENLLRLIPEHGLSGFRQQQAEALTSIPLPSPAQEAWKYTNPASFMEEELSLAGKAESPSQNDPDVLMVNGYVNFIRDQQQATLQTYSQLDPETKAEIEIHLEKATPPESGFFYHLNSVLFPDALIIRAGRTESRGLIRIEHHTTGNDIMAAPRILILAQPQAELDIVVEFSGSGKNQLIVPVIQTITGNNSGITIYKLQQEGEGSVHIADDSAWLHGSSRYALHTATFSGKMVRNQVYAALQEQNADCKLFGLYLPSGEEHVDNRTVIDHISPHCTSDEFYKGIMAGKGVAAFNGKVFVRQHAQKTNAFQQNQNILLSDTATINSKPELEIYADDVKCSHGSTTGQFDEEAVFYLRSRGITELAARKLLVHAFAAEVIDRIAYQPHREKVESLLNEKLAGIL